jgi:hypothetical protein
MICQIVAGLAMVASGSEPKDAYALARSLPRDGSTSTLVGRFGRADRIGYICVYPSFEAMEKGIRPDRLESWTYTAENGELLVIANLTKSRFREPVIQLAASEWKRRVKAGMTIDQANRSLAGGSPLRHLLDRKRKNIWSAMGRDVWVEATVDIKSKRIQQLAFKFRAR